MRRIAILALLACGCPGSGNKSAPGGGGALKQRSSPPDLGVTGSGSGSDHDGLRTPDDAPVEEPITVGAVDKGALRHVVRTNLAKLQRCYETALLSNPGIEGRVLVTFKIELDGSVLDVAASGVHPDVETCVAARFRELKFPRSTHASRVNVTYPLAFKP